MTYGARPETWVHFNPVVGLGGELLPLVSYPTATISPLSKSMGLGKTPSRCNATREAVGITGWTSMRTTENQVIAWSAEPDYGICLQTRRLRDRVPGAGT
jgi:hypothetical protein